MESHVVLSPTSLVLMMMNVISRVNIRRVRSLVKCLCNGSVRFIVESLLCILCVGVWFSDTCSQSIACLFIFSTGSLAEQTFFHFDGLQFIIFSFYGSCFQ